MTRNLVLLLLMFLPMFSFAQTAELFGIVRDNKGVSLPGATVQSNKGQVTVSDNYGFYQITLNANEALIISFSYVGKKTKSINVELAPGEDLERNIILEDNSIMTENAVIYGTGKQDFIQRLEPKIASQLPSVRGTVEDLLLQAPVNFTSELSSSYSVRGGSFDENLVYVNDIQVYRPFLVRAGEQEGMSFPNTDMIERIDFSAGGFQAKYGDKMSSVLDIRYRKPTEFGGAVSLSMLGASLQLEDRSKNKKWSHNSGFRYRNNSYILGTLDNQGDYNPNYIDFQTYITFDPDTAGPWEFNFLGNFSRNQYNFIPQTRQTDVGNINEALRLTVFFEGQELTQFRTFFGAGSASYTTDVTRLSLVASAFNTSESENFDIFGRYSLDELERDLGSDEFGDVLANRGVGGYLEHARNQLDASVLNLVHKGSHNIDHKNHFLEWGVTLQREIISDRLSEWTYLDSAGYNQPRPQDSIGYQIPELQPSQEIILTDVIKARNDITSNRIQAYFQDSYAWKNKRGDDFTANLGVRAHYWDFNNELVGGPRAQFSWKPRWMFSQLNEFGVEDSVRRNVVFRVASGLYWQPAFYREMRGLFGEVNPDIRAQQAIHFVAGVDYVFEAWDRPFKFTGELYYKDLNRLIPYEVENVRLRYYATNNANGYATGLDLMLNGMFIDGVQSWVRASVLKTAEDLVDDQYYEYFNDQGDLIRPGFTLNDTPVDSNLVMPGFIPRPTDQRFSLSLVFQDEMPRWPEYKVLLSVFYGTALPFGPPTFERYRDTERTAAYRRVDIGFSKDLVTQKTIEKGRLKWMKEGTFSIEVFNLLGINNTISHSWIEDVNGRQYSIPNFLTGRRLNAKLRFRF